MAPLSRRTMMPPVSPKIFEQNHLGDSPISLWTPPHTSANGNSTCNNDGDNDDKFSLASSVSPTSTITMVCSTPPSTPSIRRICSFNLCPNKNVQGGRCVAHGAKRKKCSHPGCLKHVKKAGMCSAHGAPRKRCDVIGCEKASVQAGRCNSHGMKKKLCSTEGCRKQSTLYGMCKQHNNERCIEKDQKGVEISPKAKDDNQGHLIDVSRYEPLLTVNLLE